MARARDGEDGPGQDDGATLAQRLSSMESRLGNLERVESRLAQLEQEFTDFKGSSVSERRGRGPSASGGAQEGYHELALAPAPAAARNGTGDSDDEAGQGLNQQENSGIGVHQVLTPVLLDCGDRYKFEMSVWDSMMFFGLPAIGAVNSAYLAVLYVMNLVMQSLFIYIVHTSMISGTFGHDVLDGLLKFRLGLAHSVEYADKVTKRSMAEQLCNGEAKLHLAGRQLMLYDSSKAFAEQIGWSMFLVLLIQFIWLCSILKDADNTLNILLAVGRLRTGHPTRLVLADLTDTNVDPQVYFSRPESNANEDDADSLADLMKVVRISRMWAGRKLFIAAVVCLPKMILAALLWWVGARWLAQTLSYSDLLLNAVALAFVLDFDDILFNVFVPRRTKTLMDNLEDLPMLHSTPGKRISGLWVGGKAAAVALILLFVYTTYLHPVFREVQAGHAIMCSGRQDFVYAVNPATSMVHIVNTSQDPGLTDTEQVVAKVVDWEKDEEVNSSMALVENYVRLLETDAWGLDRAVASNSSSFSDIHSLSVSSLAEAAGKLPCADLASGASPEASLQTLRDLMRNESIASCDDVPREFCSLMNMSWLRAICPRRCRCEDALSNYVGFFGTEHFGCPNQCQTFKAADNEISFRFELWKAWVCYDTDELYGALDSRGRPCRYWGTASLDCQSWECDSYDDTDFTMSDMCCAGGGGLRGCSDTTSGATSAGDYDCTDWGSAMINCTAHHEYYCVAYDDSSFTMTQMCCVGGGGSFSQSPATTSQGPALPRCRDAMYRAKGKFGYVCGDFDAVSCAADSCEYYDDTDFSMRLMCCVGGGGSWCSDTNYGATDSRGEDCSARGSALLDPEYAAFYNFVSYDDTDFTMTSMCCVGGGGNKTIGPKENTSCRDLGEDKFSFSGGGLSHMPTSASCWDHFVDDCWNLPQQSLAWLIYAKGMFEHIASQRGFRATVKKVIHDNYAGFLDFDQSDKDSLIGNLTAGEFGRSFVDGSWHLVPGRVHPRNLQGCNFLTSFEVRALTGLDLCAHSVGASDHSSIRFLCPKACGCKSSHGLHECPASCVLTHCFAAPTECAYRHVRYDILAAANSTAEKEQIA